MICKKCESENRKSTISIRNCPVTDLVIDQYYDQDGEYHIHDPNRIISALICSNGHVWDEEIPNNCPAFGCNWNMGE